MSCPRYADALLVEDLNQQRLPARTILAVLERAGFSAHLAHFGAESAADSVVGLAESVGTLLIVLSIHFGHLLAENLALARRIRSAGVSAHITITGPLAAFTSAELLSACEALDSVLCAEAGAAVVELTQRLADGTDVTTLPGLASRGFPAPPSPPPLHLDSLPFPARPEGIPSTSTGHGYATLEGSRGCYHACTFCLPCAFYRARCGDAPYRVRSVLHLVEEIGLLFQKGARLFLFDDEQFLPPRPARVQRVNELARELEERGLQIAFTIKSRPDDVDERLFGQLRGMGLVRVYLGIESGHGPTLARFAKGASPTQNQRALETLAALGIVADFRMLAFQPWTTVATFASELAFLEHALPVMRTPFAFHDVVCFPGTPLGQVQRGRASQSAVPYTEPTPFDFALTGYTAADPGAELLRRLNRLVLGPREAAGALHSLISEAWYAVLLRERFESPARAAGSFSALAGVVLQLNADTLSLWRDILACVIEAGPASAERVSERAAEWVGRARQCEFAISEQLRALGVL